MVNWCCLCKRNGETVNHLLLHCPFSKEVWDLVFALFGVQWVMPRRVADLLASGRDVLEGTSIVQFGSVFLIV